MSGFSILDELPDSFHNGMNMRVLNEQVVVRFARKHPDSRNWLNGWLTVARNAAWQTIQDVKRDYPAADGGVKAGSGLVMTVFDVGGNKYRLITRIHYAIQTVDVLDTLTHAQYSKDHWKRRH